MNEPAENAPDVTLMLKEWSDGNAEVLDNLMPLVYDELRRQASRFLRKERANHTLQTTALINEAYLKLLNQRGVEWQNRAHFFATASQIMRRVLVDAARARQSAKRGAGARTVSIDSVQLSAPDADVDVIALEEALDELAAIDPRPSQVVELRFFGGFSVEETAEALNVSIRTVINDWNTARAWLRRRLAIRASHER